MTAPLAGHTGLMRDAFERHFRNPDPHPQYAKKSEAGGAAPADTNPETETVGAVAAIGTSAKFARADHRHAEPGLASVLDDGYMSKVQYTRIATLSPTADRTCLVLDSFSVVDVDKGQVVIDVDDDPATQVFIE